MKKKINLSEELSAFMKEIKREHPNLKEQFDLYLSNKKEYDATKSNVATKEQKTKTSYGVKYR